MAHFSEAAKTKIIAAQPAAATWLNDTHTTSASTATGTRRPATPNKFPGACQHCHGHVAAGEGLLAKAGGKFVVYHADGTCPDKTTPATATASAAQTRPAKPNKYAGTCTHCGTWVAAEAGILVKTDAGWKAAHHDGTCPPATSAPEVVTAEPVPASEGPTNFYGGRCIHCTDWVQEQAGIRVKTPTGWKVAHRGPCPEVAAWGEGERIELTAEQIDQLPDKGYATVTFDGDDYRTFRIRTRKTDQRLYPGAIEIGYLAGPNNNSDYMPLGVVVDGTLLCRTEIHNDGMRTALGILLGDPAAAQRGWSRENTACARCGRHLSHPDSLDIYLGPECATK